MKTSPQDGYGSPALPPLLHPWRLMALAVVLAGVAFSWARLCSAEEIPLDIVQIPMLFLGLLFAGTAVWSRSGWGSAATLNQITGALRDRVFMLLAALNAVVALGVTAWLIVKLGGRSQWPGTMDGVVLLWLMGAPWCIYSAYQLFKLASSHQALDSRWETAILVSQAATVSLLGSWALYWGPADPDAWDSMRVFLGILAGFGFLAAILTAATQAVRRVAVSGLIALHFAGIICVVVGAPPGPWVLAQTQHWVFRNYIDFFYLNNAYRFYSPEPGPASQLWFRIEYEQNGEKLKPRWVKLPDMEEDGTPKYPSSVQYTRRLALTENVARVEQVSWMTPNSKGDIDLAPFAQLRFRHLPKQQKKLGLEVDPNSLEIPMHPEMQINYQRPTAEGRQFLEAYARHILSLPHPTVADAKPTAVKMYRVQHRILLAESIGRDRDIQGRPIEPADPRDWIFFLPYYVGRFDAEGRLLDPNDPFLYWLLPIVRVSENDPKSDLKCYFIKHAGDPVWIVPSPLTSRVSPLSK